MVSSVQALTLSQEAFWFDKYRCEDAERQYHEVTSGKVSQATTPSSSVADEIAQARQHILSSLQAMSSLPSSDSNPGLDELTNQLRGLQQENQTLRKVTDDLRALVLSLDSRVKFLEGGSTEKPKASPVAAAKAPAKEADDDVDLFASDEEDNSAEVDRVKEERIAAYAAKKAHKPTLIAKSSIVLDVKPWDDETDMKAVENEVRKITCEGLLWGASKLVPLAYGIKKLQISCVVEDDKVSIDWLTETIQENEDLVQSVDIAAFNKI